MPSASCAFCNAPAALTAAAAFSSAPMLLPKSLVLPGTPILKEPTSRRKRLRYWTPTGVPKSGAGEVSVENSVVGEVKSFTLTVQLTPPWQVAQPALVNNRRPSSMSAVEGAPATHG